MSDSFGLPSGAAARWGHWSDRMLIASIVGVIVLGFRPPDPSPLAAIAPGALLAFVLVSWLMMRQHDARLCELCASAMPLDATAKAERYRRRLAVAHAGSRPALVVGYLAVLFGSDFLVGSGPGRVVWALVQTSMIYLVLSHTTHRRLQPWCPQCQGGGGEERVPVDPDPVGSSGR